MPAGGVRPATAPAFSARQRQAEAPGHQRTNMKLTVLGCSGGIGGDHLRTTSLLIDDDVLVDAGTGVGDLALEQLARIDHVFLTHSHLDHIACLPLIMDAVADRREQPLTVHATPEVIEILARHVFNGLVWPDFAAIPEAAPFLRWAPLAVHSAVILDGRGFTALPVDHTVPAVGYRLDSGAASLVFSGDTGPCDAFWQAVNAIGNLRHLIIECAFPDSERELAVVSRHLSPSMLAAELQKLERACDIHVTHLKPGQLERTMAEIASVLGEFGPRMLRGGQTLEF